MARINDLLAEIKDLALRQRLQEAVADLKSKQRFGLVFEEHVPETTLLTRFPIQVGAIVCQKNDTAGRSFYRVVEANGHGKTIIEPLGGAPRLTVAKKDLLTIKRFGEPIYPALTPVGSMRKGAADRGCHAVVNGENFHALQLFGYLYEGKVDCIYIDPPYNTGARDWKYNNDYVDSNDTWRHSKWLSMMEKRLRLAKRLLKPDSVLIVTIDENEVHHLGMLLYRVFPTARRQMATICINPSGVSGEGLSRVDEYAFFCFFGNATPVRGKDDMLTEASKNGEDSGGWESLLRRGNTWYRKSRPNLCYPVLIDAATGRIIGVGEPFKGDNESKRPKKIDGKEAAWPVRKDGKLGIWRVDGQQLTALMRKGYAYATNRDEARGTWSIKYLMSGTVQAIEAGQVEVTGHGPKGEVILRRAEAKTTTVKTMWNRGRHTAGGGGGSQALTAFLGERGLFPFPKSIYSVLDCLAVAVGDKSDALIVDFFAGSGTTFNATCLLNAEDFGRRRCILVTNNEVSETETRKLAGNGFYPGDDEFEHHGIFERVTRPRCEAVVSGKRPDGKPVEGEYIDGRPYRDGFLENIEFFRIDYLEPDEIDLRNQFDAILPALWLAAGGVGNYEPGVSNRHFSIPEGSTYGVLFRESAFKKFKDLLENRTDVTHVWLVTDSEEAYAEMCSALPRRIAVSMLYRDYLRNFRINTGDNL